MARVGVCTRPQESWALCLQVRARVALIPTSEWNMSYLPMIPKKWELIVIKQTAKQYGSVKSQLFRKDIGDIIAGRCVCRSGRG